MTKCADCDGEIVCWVPGNHVVEHGKRVCCECFEDNYADNQDQVVKLNEADEAGDVK